jgi:hypothetical protein
MTDEIESLLAAMAPGEREIALRAVELRRTIVITMSDTAGAYGRLKPDGRELDQRERAVARERLEEGARCLRRMDRNEDIVDYLVEVGQETGQNMDLRPFINVLRTMQRSLVLALSDQPTRRQRAASVAELAPVVRGVLERLP